MVELTQTSLDTSMWALLQATKHLRCTDLHDKVYAILSVAESGHEGIDADYSLPIPLLMNRILRNMRAIVPPTSLIDAASHCQSLRELFNTPLGNMTAPFEHLEHEMKSNIRSSGAYRLGPKEYHFSLWWTTLYGHIEIQRLLLNSWTYDWFGGDVRPTHTDTLAAKVILEKCCFDVNTGTPWLYIQTAVVRGDIPVLQLLIRMPGLNVDVKNEHGESLLHQAVIAGDPEVLKELSNSGLFDHLRRYLHKEPGFWTNIRAMRGHARRSLLSVTTDEESTTIKRAIQSGSDNRGQRRISDIKRKSSKRRAFSSK